MTETTKLEVANEEQIANTIGFTKEEIEERI